MILTHPFLFNTIVVLFIAFTAGWIVFAINERSIRRLKSKIAELEKQKDQHQEKISFLEEQLDRRSQWSFDKRLIS